MASRQSKQLRVLLLPPMPWTPYRQSFQPGNGPDPMEIYNRLESHGITTTLLDPNPRPWNPLAGRNTLLESLDPSRAMRVLLRERRYDLVISVFEGSAAPLLGARRLLGYRPKIALWDIGLTEQWRLRERILDFVVPRVDSIMVLGSNQKPYIERRWHPKAGIEVIGHHVDTEFFRPSPPNDDGPILSVGDDAGRDFPTLVTAAQGLDAEIIIKTRQSVPEAANLHVISQRLTYRELRELYARSRFVVVPVSDTLNASGVSTILEASAMGKALVVSKSAGIRDFIVANETCLVVPPHDPNALRQAINRLSADPVLCHRLGENGRRLMEQTCAKTVFSERLAKTLRRSAGC